MADDGWGDDDEGWGDDGDGADGWGSDADIMDVEDGGGGFAKFETTAPKEIHYTLLTIEKIGTQMLKDVENVAQHLDLLPANSEHLLRFNKWNQQKVIDAYLTDPENTMKKSGIPAEKRSPQWTTGEHECPMCYDDFDVSEMDHANCGHQICKGCWGDMCTTSVANKDCVNLTCSYFKCDCRIDREMFRKYLSPAQNERYEKFCIDDYVDKNKTLVWCPAPNCTIACKHEPGMVKDVICEKVPGACGFRFCVKCKTESHRPAPCDVTAKWRMKASSESENIQYIMARTKRCPKCKVHIEKNQGCNHMTCKNCGYEFCWLCKGDWKSHGTATGGFYKCNVYEKNKKAGQVSEEEKASADAKNSLEKYMFYLTRYENHLKSIGFAKKTKEETERRMDEMAAKYNWKPNEATFLMDAVDTVIECRRLLAWTYPIGYYLPDDNPSKELFTDLQQQLEKFMEHLHELCERDMDKLADNKMRTEVKNYTRCTTKFRDNMIKGVEEEINEYFVMNPMPD